jgi:hypothetical protein
MNRWAKTRGNGGGVGWGCACGFNGPSSRSLFAQCAGSGSSGFGGARRPARRELSLLTREGLRKNANETQNKITLNTILNSIVLMIVT